MIASCVIEPSDNIWKPQDGNVKLFGFAPGPSGAVSLEAINSSNTWEVIASGTTTSRITYTGTRSGYYWELAVNIDSMPARFKVAGRVRLRAKAGTWLMSTHSDGQQKARVANVDPLVEVWNAYVSPTSNNNVITVWL
jgi:hypothetical protein